MTLPGLPYGPRLTQILTCTYEVYEPFIFNDSKHLRMCDMPGMRERTITLGSGGTLTLTLTLTPTLSLTLGVHHHPRLSKRKP